MKSVYLKTKELLVPIIQGGMGIGISLGSLAGAVALEGGMGVISTANPGYREAGFLKNPRAINKLSLDKEIKKAKAFAKEKGLVAVNVMAAITDYVDMVTQAIKSGVDCIISGAGLPLELPKYTKDTDVAIAPIVSSGKAARVICKTWDKRYGVTPDFVVIEGAEAGGHLGFSKEELLGGTATPLEEILADVKQVTKPFEEKYEKKIPVFVAGGIFDGKDIKYYLDRGADGVQIATRFIATDECDAFQGYKDMFIACKKEDIEIVKSPVGMPGRALKTPLIEKLSKGEVVPHTWCSNCLIPCKKEETQYCISSALIEGAKGNREEGLFFCGSNAYKIKRQVTVKELMSELIRESE